MPAYMYTSHRKNLLHAGPVTLACHQLFDADGILGFARQGRKIHFREQTMPSKTSRCRYEPPLYHCDHVINVAINVGEAIQCVGWVGPVSSITAMAPYVGTPVSMYSLAGVSRLIDRVSELLAHVIRLLACTRVKIGDVGLFPLLIV